MVQLIEFLVKNWYLVMIVLALFYQVNSRRQRTNRGAPNSGMPTFGNGPGDAGRPAEVKKAQTGTQVSSSGSERARDEYKQPALGKTTSTTPKQKASPFTTTATKSGAVVSSPIYANEISSSSLLSDQPTPDQVRQGVVWAEILGPPRAKKPYRR